MRERGKFTYYFHQMLNGKNTAKTELLDASTLERRSEEQTRCGGISKRGQQTTSMISDCCTKEASTCDGNRNNVTAESCQGCGNQGAPVSRKTVLLMLKPHLLEQASIGAYRFCGSPDCSTVYFEENGSRVFTTNDLRVIVGLKAKTDPIAVCYCFGFAEHHLRDEIVESGNTTIPERISSLIREGLCACDSRNPSGNCCLGEVNRIAKRLKQ